MAWKHKTSELNQDQFAEISTATPGIGSTTFASGNSFDKSSCIDNHLKIESFRSQQNR